MTAHKPFIITIVGPESSGKTTLARQLAAHYGCPWVPEYAREYLESLGGMYEELDLEAIAQGQLEAIYKTSGVQLAVGSEQTGMATGQAIGRLSGSEISLPAGGLIEGGSLLPPGNLVNNPAALSFYREEFGNEPRPIVIVDSGMLSLRMWAKIKYNSTISLVEEALREDITSVYVLCRPVYPWEPDPLREAPSLVDRVWIYNQFLKEMFRLQVK